jgi:DNA (cytosine-5)-methyltransferase 1
MTFGSLFAGIGGMDLGLERAGMECRWQVEINPFAVEVLNKHWPTVPKYGDTTKLTGDELERVDLICGGFPCQPVSLAGSRLIEEDERWLWPEIVRLYRVLRPRFLLMENVPGLLMGGGMDSVLRDLASEGLDAEWRVLCAARFGAWHLRDRCFILAYPTGERQPLRSQFLWLDPSEPREKPRYWESVLVPPRLQRVVDGVPVGLDRLKSCGNAVVPQVAEWIGRRIMEAAR